MNDPYRSWVRFYNPLVEPWLRPIRRQIVKQSFQSGFFRVLDVGCGTGMLLRMLQGTRIQAVGLELSPSMLDLSKEALHDSPSLIQGRGDFLPFPSRSFEGVVLSLMIHENPPLRRKAILQEVFRVLVPDGALFILEYQRTAEVLGRIAGMVEYVIERSVGGDHFRNYRQFMGEGALPALLAHLSGKKIRWQPAFFGSMALVTIPAIVQRDQSG